MPPEHAKVDADWRIDGCRVTYKGEIIPLGMPVDSFLTFFGRPTDSTIHIRKGKRSPAYYWDDRGIRAGSYDLQEPNTYINVNFSEGYDNGLPLNREDAGDPKGKSSIFFNPDGIVDSAQFSEILQKHFIHHKEFFGVGTYSRSIPLGDSFELVLSPVHSGSKGYVGFAFNFATKTGSQSKQTYRQVLSHLDSNCKLLPEHRDIASDSMRFERYLHRLDGIDTLIDSTTPGWSEIAEIKAKLDSLNAAKSGTFKRLREDLERAKKQRADSTRSKKK